MKYLLLVLILSFSVIAKSQNSSLKGTVTSTDGQPAASVTVSIRSLKLYGITDDGGHYLLINIKPGTYTVSFSHVGLEAQEKTITLQPGKTAELSFSLQQTAKQLDEVIITTDKTTIKKSASLARPIWRRSITLSP